MRILEENVEKGEITVQVENHTDLWHLYNVICRGDKIYARTYRRIRRENVDSRPDKGERIPVYLELEVEEVEFHRYSDRLRVKGKIISAPKEVPKGGYHTINIEIGMKLRITKEKWPSYMLKRIREAVHKDAQENVLVVAVEEGEASIALVNKHSLRHLMKISESIPGKRSGGERDAALKTFYAKVTKAIMQFAEQFKPVSIVIAGPGFAKEHLKKYISSKKWEPNDKIVLESASYGNINGIYEIVKKGVIAKIFRKSRVIREIEAVNELLAQLAKNPKMVTYGEEQVKKAVLYGAVKKLLIASKKIREATLEERREIEKMIKTAEEMRAEILIVDEEHMSGQQLFSLGGVAALLRYPFDDS